METVNGGGDERSGKRCRRSGELLGLYDYRVINGCRADGGTQRARYWSGASPGTKGFRRAPGLPTLGTVPAGNENPNLHGASLSPRPSKHKRVAADTTPTHEQASTEPRSAITFNSIQFSFGSAQITPESSETLRNLGNALNHELTDQKSFLIEGHTDAAGSPEVNTALSHRRAEAVRDYLIHEMGVSPSRLQAFGKGSSDPANPADPYAAENRRVVVVNIGS